MNSVSLGGAKIVGMTTPRLQLAGKVRHKRDIFNASKPGVKLHKIPELLARMDVGMK